MASETNSAALSAAALRRCLDQRANEHGTVQITRAREAAADVQFFDDEALAAGAAQPMYLPSARPVTTALGASVSSSSASA